MTADCGFPPARRTARSFTSGYLVPRTRSSHRSRRESGCELRVQSGTRIIELLVPFDSEVRKRVCSQNDANFGIGALSLRPARVPLPAHNRTAAITTAGEWIAEFG